MFAVLRKRRERFTSHELVPPLLSLGIIAVVVAYDRFFDMVDGPVICLFRRLTGLPCPGCGLTRSAVSFGNGDLVEAIDHHPLGVLFVLVLAAIVISWVVAVVRNRPPTPIVTSRLITVVTVLFVVNWALKFL